MKERPILFNTEMVRAILTGRKTQTRRIVKIANHDWKYEHRMHLDDYTVACFDPGLSFQTAIVKCPYGRVGDRLWVREPFAKPPVEQKDMVRYRADFPDNQVGPKWSPSIHMPRWASRLTLEIKDIRVERVCNISEADAEAEGANPEIVLPGDKTSFVDGFYWLWDTIYHKTDYGWDVNPWVWVVEFKVKKMKDGE